MVLLQVLINLGLGNSTGKSIDEYVWKRIRASFPNGTTMDPAQIRLQETIALPLEFQLAISCGSPDAFSRLPTVLTMLVTGMELVLIQTTCEFEHSCLWRSTKKMMLGFAIQNSRELQTAWCRSSSDVK
ncbi:hypothetical protein ZIOFF_055572 [Zingiber officinale]|uniref:Uncharacterized protein n=1 Tax=Zingiber officinale TaxID=94328 RepID=A0A8J5FGN6_ZINOF|nr:hypothetical protein ZIOFF_055572 [Zingiber officinale]